MALHPAAERGFSAEAAAYVRGRPDYPDEIDDWLRQACGVAPGKTVLDLGAGTGKFTARLAALGAVAIAVEPVAAMRTELCRRLPQVVAVDGTAEAIPIESATVDAVVVAQAFHWFATPRALVEIARVLRPGGALALIWNVRDEQVGWVAALTRILARWERGVPRYASFAWKSVFPAAGFGPLELRQFEHGHSGTPEAVVVDRVRSTSFIAALPPEDREAVCDEVRALIAATPELAGRDRVTFPYVTAAYRCYKLQ